MKRLMHWFWLWFLLGEQYFVIEALYRFFFKHGERAHIAMLVVGGVAVIAVGTINQIPQLYKNLVIRQAAIGTLLTLLIEFISGYILNIRLGLDIWDYSSLPGNIMGQVCLPFAIIWFLLMPLAIWLEDFVRFKFWQEGEYYTIKSIYKEFITLK